MIFDDEVFKKVTAHTSHVLGGEFPKLSEPLFAHLKNGDHIFAKLLCKLNEITYEKALSTVPMSLI